MSPTKEDIDARLADFQDRCRKIGLKCTAQRREIYRVLLAADYNLHPGVLEIRERLRGPLAGLASDTVYRTLTTLESMNLIHRITGMGDRVRFDPVVEWHGHFICTGCGAIRNVYCPLPFTAPPTRVQGYGDAARLEITWTGTCTPCGAHKGGS